MIEKTILINSGSCGNTARCAKYVTGPIKYLLLDVGHRLISGSYGKVEAAITAHKSKYKSKPDNQ